MALRLAACPTPPWEGIAGGPGCRAGQRRSKPTLGCLCYNLQVMFAKAFELDVGFPAKIGLFCDVLTGFLEASPSDLTVFPSLQSKNTR